jgi:dihydroorotate dehydrogenase
MPSQPPEVWRRDVSRAHSRIRRGQVLVVSVVGTPEEGGGEESLVEDFCRCARWASEAGADIVEANFSCPNVCTAEGSVYQDPGASGRLAAALREVLPSTPFLIKSGHFSDHRRLGNFYRAISCSADGVVLVNGVSRRVLGADDQPVFGDYERVGILGKAIHPAAVSNVTAAVKCSRSQDLGVETIAVGGVCGVEDPGPFFDAGARGVVMGGVPMLDPLLAARMKAAHPQW